MGEPNDITELEQEYELKYFDDEICRQFETGRCFVPLPGRNGWPSRRGDGVFAGREGGRPATLLPL
jgi:hypothetical protein